MSDKWLMFKNVDEFNYLSESKPYKVKEENCACYKIKSDNGYTVNIYKENCHIYDYEVFEKYPLSDNVTNPSHYNQGDIETIDFIKDKLTQEQYKGFCLGNVIKYISRHEHKNGKEDLLKADYYLKESIESY